MRISRRNFIKGASAACVLGALPPGALASQSAKPPLKNLEKSTYTVCEMCSTRCVINAKVIRDTVFFEGNSNSADQKTRVCAKGSNGYSLLKDPHRIVQPMRRKGPRGSNQWEVITWETAYKEIAEKMKPIIEKFGPESFVFSSKSGSLMNHFFSFARAVGSPNTFSHISTCPGGRKVAADAMMGVDLGWDVRNTKYLLLFGHNLYEGIEIIDTNNITEMQDSGGKVVVFDPRLSIQASKADEFYLIKPGTDVVVILAIANVIISEKLYDKEFITEFTKDFDKFAAAVKKYTPEYAEEFSGVPAEDIKRISRELAAAAPAAIASPGHRSTFSMEEFDMRRGLFAINALLGNIERKGGLFFGKSAETYNLLAGEYVAPEISSVPVVTREKSNIERIDHDDDAHMYMIYLGGVYQHIFDTAINEKPYPVKGWFMMRTNPLQTLCDLSTMLKAIDKMELIICCDVYMTDSAAYADYFLPECTYLERTEDIYDYSETNPAYSIRQPVVDIIGNTKPSWLIWKELAAELGLSKYYNWNDMEDRHLKQCGGDVNLYKELKQKGFLSYGIPILYREPESVKEFVKKYPASAEYLNDDGTFADIISFGTFSGKFEFYCEFAEDVKPGYGLPRFQNIPLKKDDELFFIQGKSAVHTNSATAFVPNLSYLMPKNPVWIHPNTATKFGIKEGDEVYLENEIGKEKGTILITKGVREDTVFTYMVGSGVKTGDTRTSAAKDGIRCANLLPLTISDFASMTLNTGGVRLSKAVTK